MVKVARHSFVAAAVVADAAGWQVVEVVVGMVLEGRRREKVRAERRRRDVMML